MLSSTWLWRSSPAVSVRFCRRHHDSTPYEAQYERLLAARERIKVACDLPCLDDMWMRKIDGAQGSKRPAVILELTHTDRVGFLKQANRLLVAWSRGKYALYVVANANKWLASSTEALAFRTCSTN
jgi:hypothetical protein